MIAEMRVSPTLLPVMAVLLIGAAGVFNASLDWRQNTPAVDLVTSAVAADRFVGDGRIPDRGHVNSTASHSPPGMTWLLVPDLLVFSDARLFGYLGVGLMHFGTLCGILFLARRNIGNRGALLAVVLYGLSSLGLSQATAFASGLGDAFFLVWMVFCAQRWVESGDSRWLAGALVIWATGMYVFLELAPSFLVLPVLWWLYRPKVDWRPVVIAMIAAGALWSPYLKFEATRGFADLKAQLLLTRVAAEDDRQSWCEPSLTMTHWDEASDRWIQRPEEPTPVKGLVAGVARRALGLLQGVTGNFRTGIFGTWLLLLVLTALGVVILGGWRDRVRQLLTQSADPRGRKWRLAVGGTLIVASLLMNEDVARWIAGPQWELPAATSASIRTGQYTLIVLALVAFLWAWAVPMISRTSFELRTVRRDGRPVVAGLLVPWTVLLFVMEHARPDRVLHLWSLQVIAIAACLVLVVPTERWKRLLWRMCAFGIVCVVVAGPGRRFVERGSAPWSGADSDEARAIALVAGLIRAEGRESGAVGYRYLTPVWVTRFSAVDRQYKVGGDLDLMLRFPHGITNTVRCAEGFSRDDEYRIVQDIPREPDFAQSGYFDVPMDEGFTLIRRVGQYAVYSRE